MKGYKGFSPGMVCRGKQYQENTEFTEPEAKICESGMHFCQNPFDVWSFYPPTGENGNLNEFAEVEAMDDPQTDDNIKYCSSRLRIGAKLDLPGFIKAGVDFILEHVKSTDSNTGFQSATTNTGNYSVATNTGDRSVATNTGDRSAATNTGFRSTATNTGFQSTATNTGFRSTATNTGDYSASSVSGNESFAIATGQLSKVKGALGCWIACAEWAENDNGTWHPIDFKAIRVDGEKIKADTWYRLEKGKFIEVEEG